MAMEKQVSKGPAIPVRLNKNAIYRVASKLSGEGLISLQRYRKSEMSSQTLTMNKALVSSKDRQLDCHFKDMTFTTSKMSRSQEAVYKEKLRLHQDRVKLARQMYQRRQEQLRAHLDHERRREVIKEAMKHFGMGQGKKRYSSAPQVLTLEKKEVTFADEEGQPPPSSPDKPQPSPPHSVPFWRQLHDKEKEGVEGAEKQQRPSITVTVEPSPAEPGSSQEPHRLVLQGSQNLFKIQEEDPDETSPVSSKQQPRTKALSVTRDSGEPRVTTIEPSGDDQVAENKRRLLAIARRRRQILDTEPYNIYRQDPQGRLVELEYTPRREKPQFELPSNKEDYRRKKLLEEESEQALETRFKCDQFIDAYMEAEKDMRAPRKTLVRPSVGKGKESKVELTGDALVQHYIMNVFLRNQIPEGVDPKSEEALQYCSYLRRYDPRDEVENPDEKHASSSWNQFH